MGPEIAQAVVGLGKAVKGVKTATNQFKGVQKSLHRFDKAQVKKSRFRQKQKV